jgi:uncharacterized protein (DUF305 family)
MMPRLCVLGATLVLAAQVVLAQTMPGMQTAASPSTQAYRDAMMKMDQGMSVTYSGDADKDFVAGMIPHHQGAIDMAKVELQYGKDAQLRKLAQDIVVAQEKEIAFMKSWQAAHAK